MSVDASPGRAQALAARLAQVEPLRRAARRTEALRMAAYVVAALAFLVLLAAAAVGSMWALGNFVTQNLLIVVPVMLACVAGVVALAIATFKALTRWRAAPDAAYRAAFHAEVLVPALREALPGFVAESAPGIDAASVDASGLFAPARDRRDVSVALQGTVGGQRLRVWALRVWRPGYSGDRNQGVDVTIFGGLLVHAPIALHVPGTVRVVSQHEYQGGDQERWGVVRHTAVVGVTQPVDGLAPGAALLLDKGETEPPPVAATLVRAWPALRAALGAPVFASVNAGGLYVAWPAPRSHRLMLEPELSTANEAGVLAREVEAVRRAVAAAAGAAGAVAAG